MNPDVADFSWLRLVIAFAVTLGLLAGLGAVLKYVSLRGIGFPDKAGRVRRLQIVESLAMDSKRRMVIVRCDDSEHLLLLSAQSDIVIQSNLPAKES